MRRRPWKEAMKDGVVWRRGGALDSLGILNARWRRGDLDPQSEWLERHVQGAELSETRRSQSSRGQKFGRELGDQMGPDGVIQVREMKLGMEKTGG